MEDTRISLHTVRERRQNSNTFFRDQGSGKKGHERREKPDPRDVKEQRICRSYNGSICSLISQLGQAYLEYSQSKQCNYFRFTLCQSVVRPEVQTPKGSCADLHISCYAFPRDTEALRENATCTFLRTTVNFLFLLGFLLLPCLSPLLEEIHSKNSQSFS